MTERERIVFEANNRFMRDAQLFINDISESLKDENIHHIKISFKNLLKTMKLHKMNIGDSLDKIER